jgi:plasmid stabilization system protein ParE
MSVGPRFAPPAGRIARIVQAIDILSDNPHTGRPVRGGKRELVIGLESTGHAALYRYVPAIDTVFILAIRGQLERSYKPRR